jgi:hypothetical protein
MVEAALGSSEIKAVKAEMKYCSVQRSSLPVE